MDYEQTMNNTRVKPKAQAKAILRKAQTDINQMNSFSIVWHLVKRHKLSLLVTICLVQSLALLGVLPIMFDMVH